MSIATKRGDAGQTGLAGGVRVSKSDLRVETYGTVDELNTVLGFARSICHNTEIKGWTEEIQRTLFRLGSNLATPSESKKQSPLITAEDVDWLTDLVHKIRFWNKLDALHALAEHLGMLKNQMEVTGLEEMFKRLDAGRARNAARKKE